MRQPPTGAAEPDSPPASAGNRCKRPLSVLVVVATAGGEFLLLDRLRPAGFWQSVTGSLQPGETARAAAVRELREETGLLAGGALVDLGQSRLFPILPAWRSAYAPGVCFNREYWFALVLPGRRLVRLHPDEHRTSEWLRLPAAARRVCSWTNRAALWLTAARFGLGG